MKYLLIHKKLCIGKYWIYLTMKYVLTELITFDSSPLKLKSFKYQELRCGS